MMAILSTNVVTQIEDWDTGQVLGYGIESDATTEEKARGAVDRLQRWILFCASSTELFAHETLRLRPAVAAPWSAISSPTGFVDRVVSTFLRGRDAYAVVNFKALAQGKPIVPTTGLQQPLAYPTTPTNEFQMDFRLARIVREFHGTTVVGYVNAKGQGSSVSSESWALFENYAPPDTSAEFRIEQIRDIDSATFANLIDGTAYTSQSNFNLGTCAYFNDQVSEHVSNGQVVPGAP